MGRKPKSRSSSIKLSPRSAVDADIEMGRRIRLRRQEKGISQRELAGHLGLTFQQLQKYEKGINRVGAARLQQIAEMLGVDISFFYDGDGKEPAVESLLVLNCVFSLRLLRSSGAETACNFGRDDCGFSALILRRRIISAASPCVG
jgi:transcriptional regulator with XRE-family HTH domain